MNGPRRPQMFPNLDAAFTLLQKAFPHKSEDQIFNTIDEAVGYDDSFTPEGVVELTTPFLEA